jgi:hypothetical protein
MGKANQRAPLPIPWGGTRRAKDRKKAGPWGKGPVPSGKKRNGMECLVIRRNCTHTGQREQNAECPGRRGAVLGKGLFPRRNMKIAKEKQRIYVPQRAALSVGKDP